MCVWFTSENQKVAGFSNVSAKVVQPNITLSKESLLQTLDAARANSALDYALKAARETNSFNAQQAALNRSFQQTSAERAMQFEAEQNQKAMDFSERMASTQYQRGVEDLKAAGLSPLLAYSNLQTGSPVGSAASGAQASGSQASGVKADTASALSVEASVLSQFYDLLALSINSGLKLSELKNQLTIARTRGLTDTLNAGASVFGSIGRALFTKK